MIFSTLLGDEKVEMTGAYDPERHFTDSRDKKGHSSSLRVNVPTGVMQSLAELVASRQVPHLRTPADCLRDALGRWLEWMVREQGVKSLAYADSTYRILEAIEETEARRESNVSVVSGVKRAYRKARTESDLRYAKALAELALTELADPEYRAEIEALLHK